MIGVPCFRFLRVGWRTCSIAIILLASNFLVACGASPPEGPWWLELSREETQGSLITLTLVAAIPLEISEEGGFSGTGDFQGEIVLASSTMAGCGWYAHWDGPVSLNGQYRDGSLDFDQMATLGGPRRARWVCDEKSVGSAQPIEEIGEPEYNIVLLMVAQVEAAWDQATAYEQAREEYTSEEFTPEIKVEDGAEAEVAGWRMVLHQGTPLPMIPPTPYPTARQTATPEPVTIHVMPDGSGDYPGLEAAVASAPPGSTITLAAGVYLLKQPLEITRALTLIGAGMDETEIVSAAEGFVVRFGGDGPFVAEGISFRHEGETAADVVVVWGGEVEFARCRFTGAQMTGESGRAGLQLTERTTGKVHQCVAEENNGMGIAILGQAQPTLEDNRCAANSGVGIFVIGQAQPILEGNICVDNQHFGILFAESAGGEARQNECSRNRMGFLIEDQALPLLESNACVDNDEAGIVYGSSAGGTAKQNECAGNGRYGIYIAETADPELIDNDCHDNGIADILDERP